MPSLTGWLLMGWIATATSMYGWLAVERADALRDTQGRVDKAVLDTTNAQTATCNSRVGEIESKLNASTLETVDLARQAGERELELKTQLADAKATADKAGASTAELQAVRTVVEGLCRERSSCREHAKLRLK